MGVPAPLPVELDGEMYLVPYPYGSGPLGQTLEHPAYHEEMMQHPVARMHRAMADVRYQPRHKAPRTDAVENLLGPTLLDQPSCPALYDEVHPVVTIARTGTRLARFQCDICGALGKVMPYAFMAPTLDMPVHHSNVDPSLECARCGANDGVEEHHWGPRAIFNDADSWPTDWLCPMCHRDWHRTIDTDHGQ